MSSCKEEKRIKDSNLIIRQRLAQSITEITLKKLPTVLKYSFKKANKLKMSKVEGRPSVFLPLKTNPLNTMGNITCHFYHNNINNFHHNPEYYFIKIYF